MHWGSWGSPRLKGAALSLSPPQASHQKIKLFLSYRAPSCHYFILGETKAQHRSRQVVTQACTVGFGSALLPLWALSPTH